MPLKPNPIHAHSWVLDIRGKWVCLTCGKPKPDAELQQVLYWDRKYGHLFSLAEKVGVSPA